MPDNPCPNVPPFHFGPYTPIPFGPPSRPAPTPSCPAWFNAVSPLHFDPATGELSVGVDDEMCSASMNPVANAVIQAEISRIDSRIDGIVVPEYKVNGVRLEPSPADNGADALGLATRALVDSHHVEKIVDASVTEVDDSEFAVYEKLKEAVFDNAVSVGANAFYGSPVETVRLRSVTTVSPGAFAGCPALEKLYLNRMSYAAVDAGLSGWGIPSDNRRILFVTAGGSWPYETGYPPAHVVDPYTIDVSDNYYYNSKSSPDETIVSIDMENAETVGESAFEACANLTTVTMPKLRTVGDHAFNNCYALTTVHMPVLDRIEKDGFNDCAFTSFSSGSLTYLGTDAFQNCASMTSVDLPSVVEAGDTPFKDCELLQNVRLPKLKALGDDFFNGCPKIKKLTLESATSIGSYAFYDCTDLVELNLPSLTKAEAGALPVKPASWGLPSGCVVHYKRDIIGEVVDGSNDLVTSDGIFNALARKPDTEVSVGTSAPAGAEKLYVDKTNKILKFKDGTKWSELEYAKTADVYTRAQVDAKTSYSLAPLPESGELEDRKIFTLGTNTLVKPPATLDTTKSFDAMVYVDAGHQGGVRLDFPKYVSDGEDMSIDADKRYIFAFTLITPDTWLISKRELGYYFDAAAEAAPANEGGEVAE